MAMRMVTWSGSDGGQCPAIYLADDVVGLAEAGAGPGGFVVQGVKLPPEVLAGLRDVAGSEDAVWVPRSLFAEDLPRLLEQVTKGVT
jgi:nucleoid-associated protein YgaU